MDNQKPKTVAINFIDNLGKKDLSISTLTPTLDKSIVDIAIIGGNAYCVVCKLKEAQIFIILIKNLEFQVTKETRPEINSKSIILEE